ncbi:regulator of nonsense transcripts 1 [Caerostris darwini]|uniref:Regulator of nonsense transcripts 1 n=1 Tax=Caerostris darwini TaxID=1538125 RepID=A0AAV4T8K3_9ARAC|nr:regulator of nonsense transcripts 1 [Caerostris darwini]
MSLYIATGHWEAPPWSVTGAVARMCLCSGSFPPKLLPFRFCCVVSPVRQIGGSYAVEPLDSGRKVPDVVGPDCSRDRVHTPSECGPDVSTGGTVEEKYRGVLRRSTGGSRCGNSAGSVEYHGIFGLLVQLEAEHDRKRKESQSQEVSSVRWEMDPSKKMIAHFTLAESDTDMRVKYGDELRLRYVGGQRKPWSGVGYVVKVPDNRSETVGIQMNFLSNVQTECTTHFAVEFVWNSVPFDRMQVALRKFAVGENGISSHIRRKLLGQEVKDFFAEDGMPEHISAPNLPELNPSQVSAAKQAMRRPISLIQGPPGTGKSVRSAALVYHLVRQRRGPVLVCAPSNSAVDHLTEKIHRTGLKVVRLYARSREAMSSPVSSLALHHQVRNLEGHLEFHQLRRLKDETGELQLEMKKRYTILKKACER